MFSIQDKSRNKYMLTGSFARKGYDWWWHSFTAVSDKTGEEKPFFVEFFLVNPKSGSKVPVFGQLKENREKGIKPSYLMVKAGAWGEGKSQLHRFFGIDSVKIGKGIPYSVEAEDCYASEDALRGTINISKEDAKAHPEWMCDSGSISFNLKIDKKVAFNVGYGASGFFRAIKAYEMYWHAEGMKSLYSGTINYNGETYTVRPESSYGYADKNWGRGFTTPWVWLSSCNLTSNISGKKLENSVFDIGGGKPKIYFVGLDRKLLGGFYYEGADYEYNFSKFWMKPSTEFSFEEHDDYVSWFVRQENRDSVMETKVECLKKDMILVNYEAPDGSKRHNRLWNGGNGTGNVKLYRKTGKNLELIDDIAVKNIGCEYGEYDR